MPTLAATPEQLVAEMLDSGVKLPPLPSIGATLLGIVRQPIDTIDTRKLTSLVESDPSLSARLLRMANSPYYGASGTVTSLRQAVVMIGLEETVQTLYYYVLLRAMPQFPAIGGFSCDAHWTHSWACATAARMLGRPQLFVRSMPGELYLAGLLHGIGRLALALHRTEDFRRCVALATEKAQPLHEAEREALGFDHAALGARLLDAWNLPVSIQMAVAHHLAPDEAPEAHREMASLIQLAYALANQAGFGAGVLAIQIDPASTVIARDGQSAFSKPDILESLTRDIATELNKKSEAALAAPDETGHEQATDAPPIAAPASDATAHSRPPEPREDIHQTPARGGLWNRMIRFLRSTASRSHQDRPQRQG